MKKLFLILTAIVLGVSTASAQIKVTDNLSLTGFLDMSAVNDDGINTMSFDQLEVDLLYDYGNGVTARADLNSLGGGNVVFEQGFVHYKNKNGAFIQAGKFLSCSGWETAEPDGLYQFSTSATLVYGGYQNGVAVGYGSEKFGLYGSVVSSVWNGADTDAENIGLEGQISLMPAPGLTAKVAYLWEDTGAFNTGLLNAWASYATGPLTLAGELNLVSNWQVPNTDGTGFLVMANVALSDRFAVTGRYSQLDLDNASKINEITFSPSFSLTNNWLILAEVRRDIDPTEKTVVAVETLFSF